MKYVAIKRVGEIVRNIDFNTREKALLEFQKMFNLKDETYFISLEKGSYVIYRIEGSAVLD